MAAETRWLMVYVIVIVCGRFLSQSQRRVTQSPRSQWQSILKDPTAIVAALSAALGIGMAVTEGALKQDHGPHLYVRLPGLAVLLAGLLVGYLANREIGKNWSPSIEKSEAQMLVTSGIYHVVRHPLYLSGLLVLVGTNVYFRCTWAWAGAALVLLVTLLRIEVEEQRLAERFGEAYLVYQRRTKKILPWVY